MVTGYTWKNKQVLLENYLFVFVGGPHPMLFKVCSWLCTKDSPGKLGGTCVALGNLTSAGCMCPIICHIS